MDLLDWQLLLATEYLFMNVSRVNATSHQLTSPGVFVQGVLDQTGVELFSSAALWHLCHCSDYDLLPVDVLGESAGTPLPPTKSFVCLERFDVSVALDKLFDHE
ncbi:hypothetical protein D3C78_1425260 [compost metagenome]